MVGSLACIYHWYAQALFFAPVLLVGAWCWRRYRRLDDTQPPPAPPAAGAPTS